MPNLLRFTLAAFTACITRPADTGKLQTPRVGPAQRQSGGGHYPTGQLGITHEQKSERLMPDESARLRAVPCKTGARL